MSVLYGAGSWIYRASGILEAIFHLSEAFYGLDATFELEIYIYSL